MKKVLFVGMVFGALALTSCKKDYTCKHTDSFYDQEYKDLSKTQATAAKSTCTLSGGTWSKK
ncbi:MAG TPA: hypothetical protein VFD77_00045 [Brumimicrobium sp.]|nr:hypothetical protein [Brumimicrobium sp.]